MGGSRNGAYLPTTYRPTTLRPPSTGTAAATTAYQHCSELAHQGVERVASGALDGKLAADQVGQTLVSLHKPGEGQAAALVGRLLLLPRACNGALPRPVCMCQHDLQSAVLSFRAQQP